MEARMRDDFHRQQEAKEQRLVEEESKRQLERDEVLAWKLQKEECYIVGVGLNCKFIDLLFKRSVIKFIEISFHLDFIVSEIIYNQTDTLTQRLMNLR